MFNLRLFKGILLVAGTSIGGGMLALPVLTSLGGFVPSIFIYLSCWIFMATTGFLFLEVACWSKKDANILAMAELTLGRPGKVIAWGLYLFLFYCLTLAYIVGCGNLLHQLLGGLIPEWGAQLLFLVIFGPFVFLGTGVVSRFNLALMLGLILCYLAFVIFGASQVQSALLFERMDWSLSFLALPVAFAAFAFQGIVPTLLSFFEGDVKQARSAVLIGSSLPLLVYIIWQGLILGIVPVEGEGGLREALLNGHNAVYSLRQFVDNPWIYLSGQLFAFFALVTSFFGVTLGLVDFLAEGLSVPKSALGRLSLCLLIFVPTLAVAMAHPHVFLTALDYAGGFGCALLLGLLPVAMVWSGRYRLGLHAKYKMPGGKPLLLGLAAFVILELIAEVLSIQQGI